MGDFVTEAVKKIQLVVTPATHEFLRQLADEAGVTQGFALHILLEDLKLNVGVAKESGLIDEDAHVAALELSHVLTVFHKGLLGDKELERYVTLAHVQNDMGPNLIHKRLAYSETFTNERIDQLRPLWAKNRKERAARRQPEWDAAKVAAKMMQEAENANALADEAEGIEAKYREATAWMAKKKTRRQAVVEPQVEAE